MLPWLAVELPPPRGLRKIRLTIGTLGAARCEGINAANCCGKHRADASSRRLTGAANAPRPVGRGDRGGLSTPIGFALGLSRAAMD